MGGRGGGWVGEEMTNSKVLQISGENLQESTSKTGLGTTWS